MKKTVKRILALVLTVAFLCTAMISFSVSAEGNKSISLSLGANVSPKVGDTVVLTLAGSNFSNVVSGINGFMIDVNYDSSKFTYKPDNAFVAQGLKGDSISAVANATTGKVTVLFLGGGYGEPQTMEYLAAGDFFSLSFTAIAEVTPATPNFSVTGADATGENFTDATSSATDMIAFNVPTLSVTVAAAGPAFSFGTYNVSAGNVISGLKIEMDAATFMKGMTLGDGVTVKLLDLDLADMNDPAYSGNYFFVGTGVTVQVYVNDVLHSTYKTMLRGDADGNGSVDSGDMYTIKRYIIGLENLQNVFLTAGNADMDEFGEVDSGDMYTIKRFIIGIETILQD